MAFCGAKFDDHKIDYSPTVVPCKNFDPETDSKTLYSAMKGLGTNEKNIINIVANRSSAQLMAVEKKFNTLYGSDLKKWLGKELRGHLEKVVLGRFFGPHVYQAYVLRHAMAGMGTDERALIDVICTKNRGEMARVKKAYDTVYERDLIQDIQSETSGHFRRILVSLAGGGRENKPVDLELATKEAKALHEAGEGKWGTDEATFNMIFATRSFPQLRATMLAYKKLTGQDMDKVIAKEMSGDLKRAFLTLVQYILDPITYYSEVLFQSMKGIGTDDNTLIRTVLSRCEIDLGDIKKRFEKLHQKTLDKAIKSETSGDYRKIMLEIVSDYSCSKGSDSRDDGAEKPFAKKPETQRTLSEEVRDEKIAKLKQKLHEQEMNERPDSMRHEQGESFTYKRKKNQALMEISNENWEMK